MEDTFDGPTIMAEQLSADQLRLALQEARRHLADIDEERHFTLGGTGVHIGGRKVAELRVEWDAEEGAVRRQIAALEEQLATLRSDLGAR